jgi:hypothetical protein
MQRPEGCLGYVRDRYGGLVGTVGTRALGPQRPKGAVWSVLSARSTACTPSRLGCRQPSVGPSPDGGVVASQGPVLAGAREGARNPGLHCRHSRFGLAVEGGWSGPADAHARQPKPVASCAVSSARACDATTNVWATVCSVLASPAPQSWARAYPGLA